MTATLNEEGISALRERINKMDFSNVGMALFCKCQGYNDESCEKCYFGQPCQEPLLISDDDEICESCTESRIWTAARKSSNRVSGIVFAETRERTEEDFDCICEHGRKDHCRASSHWETAK